MASGTSTYSAWQPSMVLPKRQPPIGLPAVLRAAGAVLRAQPHRQALEWPLGVMAPAITRWPSR